MWCWFMRLFIDWHGGDASTLPPLVARHAVRCGKCAELVESHRVIGGFLRDRGARPAGQSDVFLRELSSRLAKERVAAQPSLATVAVHRLVRRSSLMPATMASAACLLLLMVAVAAVRHSASQAKISSQTRPPVTVAVSSSISTPVAAAASLHPAVDVTAILATPLSAERDALAGDIRAAVESRVKEFSPAISMLLGGAL